LYCQRKNDVIVRALKINFGYFWQHFRKEDNYFTRLLSIKYDIEISDKPDLYFFTHSYDGTHDYLKYKCNRVFIGCENERANWNICDYVLDFDFINNNPRHKRWPIWATYNPKSLTAPKDTLAFQSKKKFCCMVVSNGNARERNEFFHLLSKYKKVDSGGKYLNNVGGPVPDKMEFIKDYKFVLSFENSSYPGYTTEKLIQPMFANSIPIYWGNPVVNRDFNTNSFINIPNRKFFDEAIERIIELDKDDQKYITLSAQPWFTDNHLPEEMTTQSLLQFLEFVIEDSRIKRPVGKNFLKDKIYKTRILSARIKAGVYSRLGIKISPF